MFRLIREAPYLFRFYIRAAACRTGLDRLPAKG